MNNPKIAEQLGVIVDALDTLADRISTDDDNFDDVIGQRLSRIIQNFGTQIYNIKESLENEMLLYPDVHREQHRADHYVYATPCSLQEWNKLMELVRKAGPECKPKGYMPHVFIKEDDEEICIIPRVMSATDEDCMATAAYIRMVREFTGMIYVVPTNLVEPKMDRASIIARAAGVDPKKVRHVTL